jgi:hypothetical protein
MAFVVSGLRTGVGEMRCKVPAMRYALVTAATMLDSDRFSRVRVQDEKGSVLLEGETLRQQVAEQMRATPHLTPRRFRSRTEADAI